ncbi:putative methyltransferase chloroplastic isoform X1 [Gossypium australe]|uniref:Putative methyltransferase chloroplastic isoform X1 n=1 Tax=Gossypium australe TaxID=47621 RepID=A0A5B6UBX6_9ROSI|nr:putative methyltransferase chloroplastic isoform X1 [Gossypium australe]
MNSVITGNFRPAFFPSQLSKNSARFLFRPFTTLVFTRSLTAKVRAFVETKPTAPIAVEKEESGGGSCGLACPICYNPLTVISDSPIYVGSTVGSTLQCNTCKKTYSGTQTHLDLVASSGSKQYDESMPLATELFRLNTCALMLCPKLVLLLSYFFVAYWDCFHNQDSSGVLSLRERLASKFCVWRLSRSRERGNLIWDRITPQCESLINYLYTLQFDMAKNYLKRVLGGKIVDASCGSGMFTRLFAKSGLFSQVIALDYSENMLRQCYEFIEQVENFPKEKVTLVRADISRLPFESSSIDAVHAGAALHCWPSPSTAVAEISRVLRPGGVFVATTYIFDGPFTFLPFVNTFRQNMMGLAGSYFAVSERELEDLCRTCGLVGFSCMRNGQFVMISARKRSS